MYNNITQRDDIIRTVKPIIKFNFVNGAYCEILYNKNSNYNIKFIDDDTAKILHQSNIDNNMWTKANQSYFTNWRIVVTDLNNNKILLNHKYNPTNLRVYIAFDSKSLGDTIAWIPYVEEFRLKHNCKVVCSTFMNDMFSSEYPHIEFIEPGSAVSNIYAMYTIGLYYDGESPNYNRNPTDPKTIPLQQIASDILGIDYTEIHPKIKNEIKTISTKKQVTIGIHSTAQSKYWNNPNGWQEVVDWLISEGYIVKILSKEGDGYMGNYYPIGANVIDNTSMDNTINELLNSEFYVGLSSGLSWLSWGLGVKTVLISGFSEGITEMKDCVRISAPDNVCSGCFNRYKFNPSDWNWCPDNKGTAKQFECSKLITSKMVIDSIKSNIINKK
jgi:autotransporter strand-loop-strand O-heptosyltransferase